ncbi:hypothetical protein FGU65_14465 [Methanoculleus sp. FWC-SCC1]|uniref:MerR family transcriptional regulator n=1 Tax=Methanoculleus frigidifontis TaxID=2584085 RepID=A0ABT8MDT3_9EURY|nr:hypothetical protein [Methanoculleus sp. FWC-SCC1]MDN7026069.1 hypothetical protein [Methanoculleus sp. FWC-SCC1]
MKEKELKIDDIAHLTGLSVEEVRHLVREYDDLFSYRMIGKAKLFPQKAVKIIQNLKELSGKGLAPDEVRTEVRAGKVSQAPAGGAEETVEPMPPGVQLPPEIVVEFRMMQDAIAHQHRQIARLTGDLAQERAATQDEVASLLQVIDRLTERLNKQEQKLGVIADWVEYFDARVDTMDEALNRRLSARIRAALKE